MIRLTTILALLSISLCSTSSAYVSGLGVGFMLGEPTGVSIKKWTGSRSAFAGGVAWSFGSRDAFRVHADYLFHNFGLFHVEKGRLPFYYGIGAQLEFEDIGIESNRENEVGARIPIGLNYIFSGSEFDIFFEVVPVFNFAPSTEFRVSGGIGVRYFFQ